MKTCSKCQIEKEETEYVKSPRYKDGLYPSCKSCRKKAKIDGLARNKMCSKCGANPHSEGHPYCYSCLRESKGQPPVPKFTRDSGNKTMCCKCKIRPRLPYVGYCSECHQEYNKGWMKEQGGQWKYMTDRGNRIKALARHYVNQKVGRGQFRKDPCRICQSPLSEAHHYLGYDREHWLDVVWLCKEHHLAADRGEIKFDKTRCGVVVLGQTSITDP